MLSAVKALLLIFLLSGQLASAADFGPEKYARDGQLILTQFVSAPFPHASRTNGHRYQADFYPADQHYADSTVALFVPNGFRDGGRVDFVVHFHGWRNTVAGTLKDYQLIEQLIDSGKNAILVVPEGPRNAPDSSGGKLEETNGFKRFIAEAVATLQQRGLMKNDSTCGDIILSGHSGGYQVIAAIVERGGLAVHVKEVWLFDALYGQAGKFLAWSESTGGRLIDIYTDGGGTKSRTEEMMTALTTQGTKILAATDQSAALEALKTNQFVFLHTDLGHNDVVAKRQTFRRFLETSRLADIRKD